MSHYDLLTMLNACFVFRYVEQVHPPRVQDRAEVSEDDVQYVPVTTPGGTSMKSDWDGRSALGSYRYEGIEGTRKGRGGMV